MSATRPAGSQSMSSTSRAATSRVSMGWNRTPRSVHSTGENRWIEKILLIRSWNWVARNTVWPTSEASRARSTRSLVW